MRFTPAGLIGVLVATAAVALAPSASAAVIRVPGPGDKSIQEGVDKADPGDTVLVRGKKISYFENVQVNENRVEIRGVKHRGHPAVVDGSSRDGTNHDLTFDIEGNGVTLRNLHSRHGNAIDCTGDGCSFQQLTVSMSDHGGDCIEIEGARAAVRMSRFVGCDDDVIDIDGNRARIADNDMRQSDSDCMELEGDNYRIVRNHIHNCEDGNGLQHAGDDARIRGNFAANTDADGFDVDGNRNLFTGNFVRGSENDNNYDVNGKRNKLFHNRAVHTSGADCYLVDGIQNRVRDNNARFCDGGYQVDGENMRVVGNLVRDSTGDTGIDIACFDQGGGASAENICQEALIKNNRAEDNGNDDEGFEVSDNGSRGMVITQNVSVDNNDGGFDLDVHRARITDNVSRRDGAEGNEPGLDIDGAGNDVEGNRVSSSGDDGINVDGGNSLLVDNTVRRSNLDGIHLSGGTDSVMRGNRAISNFGDGIENDGDDSVIVNNTSVDNRRDCASDGTIERKEGNNCEDGSNFNQPGGIDRRRR